MILFLLLLYNFSFLYFSPLLAVLFHLEIEVSLVADDFLVVLKDVSGGHLENRREVLLTKLIVCLSIQSDEIGQFI